MKLGELVAAATLVGCACVAACSSSDAKNNVASTQDAGASSSSTSSTSGSAPDSGSGATGSAYAQAICAWNDRCDPSLNLIDWGTTAACIAGTDKYVASETAAADTGVTEQALAACAAAANAAPCTQDPELLDICRFKGTRAGGKPCSIDAQCQGGRCTITFGQTCGTCQVVGQLGDPCTTLSCQIPLRCDDKTSKCVARAASGQPCSTSVFCASFADRCINNVCMVGAAKGAPCTPRAGATEDSCGPDLLCVSGACTTLAVTQQPGQSCGNGIECINGGCIGEQPPYTCIGNLGEGVACDDPTKPIQFCGGDLTCLSICQYPSAPASCK